MSPRLSTAAVPALLVGLVLVGCARYRGAPLDAERVLRAGATPAPASPLGWEDAVRFAVAHNPDLAALRARAAAVNLDPAREPVEVGAGVDADHRGEFEVSLDALSLLGLGVRPYDVALACARRDEATLAHHARAREIAGELAERFAVERALAALTDPDDRVDVSAFVRAGLESGAAESASAATAAAGAAERAARTAERDANRAALARLLGLASAASLRIAPVAPGWPVVPTAAPATLVATLGEVQRRIAAFEVADREIRRVVASQYPTVVLEPGIAADPTSLFGAVRLHLPVGLAGEVHALEQAREAARADVESAILDGMREAAEAAAHHTAAQVALTAASKRVESAAALLKGARVRLEVASGSPVETVFAADAVVDAAAGLRTATLDEIRARVRAARAAGFPSALP